MGSALCDHADELKQIEGICNTKASYVEICSHALSDTIIINVV